MKNEEVHGHELWVWQSQNFVSSMLMYKEILCHSFGWPAPLSRRDADFHMISSGTGPRSLLVENFPSNILLQNHSLVLVPAVLPLAARPPQLIG